MRSQWIVRELCFFVVVATALFLAFLTTLHRRQYVISGACVLVLLVAVGHIGGHIIAIERRLKVATYDENLSGHVTQASR